MSDIVDIITPPSDFPDRKIVYMTAGAMRKAADEITRLRAEVDLLKTAGIVELAAHNHSVMDYIQHWEGRTLKAEAEVERLRAVLEWYADKSNHEDQLVTASCGCCTDYEDAAIIDDAGERARTALGDTHD